MEWNDLFGRENQPTYEEIDNFIGSSLWKEINDYLRGVYAVQPKMVYSPCQAQPGWNVKYHNKSKALCTLYPMQGYFIALVVISNKEEVEAELLMPALSNSTQNLYSETKTLGKMGKWLMLEVFDSDILEDVKKLIAVKVKPKI